MSALQGHLERAGSICVLIGKDSPKIALDDMLALGGGWKTGVQLWRELSLDYALLLADSRARIEKLAPIVLVARDCETLLEAVNQVCARLAGRECVWMILDQGAGGARVTTLLAANAAVAGHA
jgi:hypothetical protein